MAVIERPDQRRTGMRYKSIDCLKAVCIVGIFCWHADILTGPTDWGARFSEVFFACSGVMEGLLHHGSYQYTIAEPISLLRRKLRRVWPLHIVMLLISSLIASHGVGLWRITDQPVVALINALLCQSWFRDISFSFNGSSWFLSSLAFCWLMSSLLDWCICKVNHLTGRECIGAILASCMLLLLYVVLSTADQMGIIAVGRYTFPPIRFCAYGFAYSLGCLMQLSLNKGYGHSFAPFEVLPIVIWLMVSVLVQQSVAIHMLMATLLVVALIMFRGSLDSFCGILPSGLMSSFQLPFYLSQEMCIRLFRLPRAVNLFPSIAFRNLGAFVACICFCACWNLLNPVLFEPRMCGIKELLFVSRSKDDD